jgi:hypothetical protein
MWDPWEKCKQERERVRLRCPPRLMRTGHRCGCVNAVDGQAAGHSLREADLSTVPVSPPSVYRINLSSQMHMIYAHIFFFSFSIAMSIQQYMYYHATQPMNMNATNHTDVHQNKLNLPHPKPQ